jgi:hypothetical protein
MCQSTLVSLAVIVIAASIVLSFVAAASMVGWVFVRDARQQRRARNALAAYERDSKKIELSFKRGAR